MSAKNFEAKEPCVACKKEGEGMVTFHHLLTQKVYPEFKDEPWNKIPVCGDHHTSGVDNFHSKGTSHMANKFRDVEKWLKQNDWFFDPFIKKWRREGF